MVYYRHTKVRSKLRRILVDQKDNDAETRARMVRFIKAHYAKSLGEDIRLLDSPEGLETLHKKYAVNKA